MGRHDCGCAAPHFGLGWSASDAAEAEADSKDATLETGAIIQVPLCVEIGDVVKVKPGALKSIGASKKRGPVSLARSRRWHVAAQKAQRARR